MTTMIEHVARAIAAESPVNLPYSVFAKQAHVAIQAMREPTRAMLDTKQDFDFKERTEADDLAEWQAMIDAALSEEAN
jgi:hypothetical protein